MTDRLLGCFRLGRELGAGGMGKVHAATVVDRCPGLDEGTRVALKIVHPHLLEQPGFFRRFLREAEIGASVDHPNVVRTYLADALGREHFLVMEYVEGQTLRELLEELERVPEELCRHIGREVARGLAAIHEAGVVHRDLKPENVLITPEHEVKVMDLGVARLQDETVRLSQTGAFVGSLHYAAPEAFRDGGGVDGRADLHALGVLLYELACGVNPFLGDDLSQTIEKVLHEEPRRLGDANPQLSPFFEELVHGLLAKDREQRFATAGELLQVLEEGEDSTWWNERASIIRKNTKRQLRRIRIPRETAVYGREKDLAQLRALYEQAKSGDGHVVLIEGEAGIGKSRLVDELIGRLQADGEDLNFLFGSYPPTGAATAAGAWSTAFREQFGGDGSAPYLTETRLLVPAFDAVLRGDAAPRDAEPLTKESLATCFVHATRGLARERTTVVLIEDLHFAPDDARDLFTSLALAVPGHRVLLVGTLRPGVPEDWLANLSRLDHTTHATVDRLGPKDLTRLLVDAFRSERLAEELAFRISQKSDGNPFFVFEIIRGLREGQFVTQQDDGTWVGTKVVDEIRIPSSVLDLVNARVADLDDDERNLLDVAACAGFEFDPTLVGRALGMSRVPVLQAMGRIEKRHRLVRSSGRSYVFDHHQVQEALYGALNEQLREEYHAALALGLEARSGATDRDVEQLDGTLAIDLCRHFLLGAAGERALRYLDAAVTTLNERYLFTQSAELAERALAMPGLLTGPRRAEVLLRLCEAGGPLARLDRHERCEKGAREVVRLAEDASDEGLLRRGLNALGCALGRSARRVEADAVHERVLELARTCGDRESEAAQLVNLGSSLMFQGRLEEADAHVRRGLAISREVGHRKFEATATCNLANVLLFQGRLSDARELFGRYLELSREAGDRAGEAIALGGLGSVDHSEGRNDEARRRHRRNEEISHAIGDRRSESGAVGNLGNVFLSEGRLCEAREQYQRSRALSREIGHREGESVDVSNLGTAAHCLGRLSEARTHLEHSLELSRELGQRYLEGAVLVSLADLADDNGDLAEAMQRAEEALALRREFRHGEAVAWSLVQVGDLRRQLGDVTGARSALEEAATILREGSDDVPAVVLALLACLPGGDVERAARALEQQAGAHSHHRGYVCRLLFEASGDPAYLDEAKRLLDEALSKVPEEYHDSMCRNVRVNREILAAWRSELGEDGGA